MRALVAIGVLLVAAATLSQVKQPQHMPDDVVIFAVDEHEGASSVDPIVVVHYGADQRFKTIPALNAPSPTSDSSDETSGEFQQKFYRKGTTLSVFSGGQRLGAATVTGSNPNSEKGDCIDLSVPITYTGPTRPHLAANTQNEIPGHQSSRRAASPGETAILRQLVVQWLTDYGLDGKLLHAGTMTPVISATLRKHGSALIGRFDVRSKKAIHQLFAIAERDGTNPYHLTLSNLYIETDLLDETDKGDRTYIDQLDIDNDGQDELITSMSHYESWSYEIWRFDTSNRVWRREYHNVAGGC